eukprot:COSAG05_NODE_71_length_22071_cov_17.527149_1_plen_80_part_00
MHNERPRLTSKGKRGIAHILLQVKARVRDESHDEDAALLPRHVAWAEEWVPTLRAALHSYGRYYRYQSPVSPTGIARSR